MKPSNWSIRAKLAALVAAASVLPLALSAWLDIRDTRAGLTSGLETLLAARTDQIVHEFDSIHQGYVRSTDRVARLPVSQSFCEADEGGRVRLRERLLGVLKTFPASDPDIRGAGVIGRSGHVLIATEEPLDGLDLSTRTTVRDALAGTAVISSVYLSAPAGQPMVAYILPVRDRTGKVLCAVSLWVRAEAFWRALKASNDLAGPGSFGVLYDSLGIRIAHTRDAGIVYHPAGPLARQEIEQLAAEKRFGDRTRTLLEDVRPFPGHFERARAATPDPRVFSGTPPSTGKPSHSVARRLRHVNWTVFYVAPEENLTRQLSAATRDKLELALGIMGLALLAGAAFAASILRPVRELAEATDALSAGAEDAQVPVRGNDELARLGSSFNKMADRLREQGAALRQSHSVLENQVSERTALLNAIVDNSMAVIYAKDLDGRFLLVNDLFCTLFHLRREEVIGRTNHEIFDAATADTFRAMDVRVADSPRPLLEEEPVPQDDGLHTYLSIKCRLCDPSGKVYGIVGVSTDITERQQAQARQLAQLERLRLLDGISTAIGARHDLQSIYGVVASSLEEQMPVELCTICTFDLASNTLVVSRGGGASGEVARRAGLADTREAAIPIDSNGLGRCVRGELIHEAELAASKYAFSRQLANAGMGSAVMAPLTAEGRVFGVLIAARRDANAFSSADCEFLRQVTSHVALAAQQAQLTDALRRAYDDLRESQQTMLQQERLSALGQMASGIAHDINNAISPAALYAESLLERGEGLDEQATRKLTIIARAIDDVAATVARMREFYRPREPAAMPAVDLNEMARQVLEMTRARWSDMPQQRGVFIELVQDLAPNLPAVVATESEVREALINLVFNAVDAMPEGGRLTLSTSGGQEAVVLQVADTGVGMDDETRRRCLEPFFTTKGERGTGLGLAMVYGVAQRNDAQIEIDSEAGRGTVVRLRFHASKAASAIAHEPPARSMRLPLRILLVDDDSLLLRSLEESLASEGHHVTACPGGAAGIAAFLESCRLANPFDVVITDLGMPNIDGTRVAQEVKQASPATPVILLTGWGQRLLDEGDAGLPAHVDLVMGKPPHLHELRLALSRVMKSRSR